MAKMTTKKMIKLRDIAAFCLTALACLAGGGDARAQVNTNRMMQIGRNALYFEDYVLSIQYFNRVIIVKPYLADPYYYRAIAKYYLDDMTGCETDCSVALDINPFLVEAYNLRGIARLRLDKPTAARDDFDKGLVYEPENVNMLMNSGIASINLKEYDTAIGQYDKLLRLNKRNVSAILYRGIALVEKGDTAAALEEFSRATKINAYSPDAFTYLGMLRYQTRDYTGALESYNHLAELRPKDAYVYVNRAITKYNLDDLRGSEADLDEAIRLDPKNKMAYQNRGLLRAQAGDLNRAADDFSHALAIDPSDDITLFNRALTYIQTGQATNALQDLNIIIAKHPDFGAAYAQRAIVKRQIGDIKGSEMDYMTAMTFEEERAKNSTAQSAKDDKAAEQETNGGKKKGSRSKNDNDMRHYDQMVVVADFGDNDEKLRQDNKESIRGRVQDRDIAIDLEPAFSLSFFNADTLLPNAPYYSPAVVEFNTLGIADRKMVVTNREVTSDKVSAEVFGMIGDVNKKLDEDPGDPSLYLLRGTLYSTVMNYNSALTDLSVCLLKEPDNKVALFNRAAARYKMVETIRDMDSDVPTAAEMPGALTGAGAASIRHEVAILDYDLILKDLERVIEIEPDNEFAYYNMSLVYCQRKQMDKAEELLGKAIGIYDQFAEAYFNRGIIRIYLGREDEGIADLSHAGELGMFKAYNVIKRYRERK